MERQTLFVAIIFIIAGSLLFLNSKKISENAYKFYQAMYTRKNLNIMFKITGLLLILAAILLILFK